MLHEIRLETATGSWQGRGPNATSQARTELQTWLYRPTPTGWGHVVRATFTWTDEGPYTMLLRFRGGLDIPPLGELAADVTRKRSQDGQLGDRHRLILRHYAALLAGQESRLDPPTAGRQWASGGRRRAGCRCSQHVPWWGALVGRHPALVPALHADPDRGRPLRPCTRAVEAFSDVSPGPVWPIESRGVTASMPQEQTGTDRIAFVRRALALVPKGLPRPDGLTAARELLFPSEADAVQWGRVAPGPTDGGTQGAQAER